MRLRVVFLLALITGLAPLFVNCQRSPEESRSVASSDDDASIRTFSLGSKLELDASTLIHAPQILAKRRAAGRIYKSSSSDAAVASGTRLMVVVDKACAAQVEFDKTNPGLSHQTLSKTSTRESGDLRIQAFNVTLEEPKLVAELADEAEHDGCVLQVANNVVVSVGPTSPDSVRITAAPNDPSFPQLTHLTAINASAGWDTFSSPGRGISQDVIVAVIDSGVDYSHPDLRANMWKSSTGKFGKDFYNNDDDPMDDNEHGTHVAGLLGGVANNGEGVAGVMGKHIKIMAVKALGADGSGTAVEMVNAIRWAADQGAEVLNLSVEITGVSTAVRDALTYASQKGAVIVVASGNSAKEITAAKFVAPAGYCPDIAGAISVASVDSKNGALSDFSNYSSSFVMIAAPGSDRAVIAT